MTLRVLLADDEPLALRGLENALQGEKDVEIVGFARTGTETVRAVRSLNPDLVFLDVQMPGLTGLEVVAELQMDRSTDIIFVTAFDHYAAEAFAIEAVDYLLKPLSLDRLRQSLQRARRRRLILPSADTEIEPAIPSASLHFPDRHGGFSVLQSDIVWIEAAKDYVLVHTENRSLILRTTMNDLADLLSFPLMRVHRSAYVALHRVLRMVSAGRGVYSLMLNEGTEVQVGPSYGKSVRTSIQSISRESGWSRS